MATDSWVLQATRRRERPGGLRAGSRPALPRVQQRARGRRCARCTAPRSSSDGCLTDYQTVEADREGALHHVRRALAGERVVVSAFSGEEGPRTPVLRPHPRPADRTATRWSASSSAPTTSRSAGWRSRHCARTSAASRHCSTTCPTSCSTSTGTTGSWSPTRRSPRRSSRRAAAPSCPATPSCHPTTRTSSQRSGARRTTAPCAGESLAMETTVPTEDGAHTMENRLRPVRDDDGDDDRCRGHLARHHGAPAHR